MNFKSKIFSDLQKITDDVTDCARNIYYAKKSIADGNNQAAQTLLNEALKNLGVDKPGDVGLSEYGLGLHNETRNSNTKDQNTRRNRNN